ncbi:hypothetical protein MMC28_005292 [Mycoblastus sanguinarius]|nr:hypothetical protein [Mycoblastus sanguinarius]
MPSSGSWTDVRSLQPLISDANSDIDSATLVPSDASAGSIDLGVNSDNSNQNTVADYETYSNSSSLDIAFPDNGELHPLLPINNHEDAAESEGSHNSSVFGDSFSDRGYHPLLPGRNYGYTVEFEAEPDTFSLSGTSSSDGNVLDSLLLSGEYSDVVELEVEVDTSPLIRQAFSDNIGSNSVPPSISHYATAGYEIQSYSTYLRNASEDIINRTVLMPARSHSSVADTDAGPPNRIPSSSISDRTGIHFPIRYLMASPNAAEGLSSSENTAPNAFNVSDWVHQQSLQDQLFGHTIASQSACIKTPPPRNMHPEDTKTNISNLVDPPGSFKPTRKVYGIATLLRMRETTSAVPVMLRVKPEAIAGKNQILEPSA